MKQIGVEKLRVRVGDSITDKQKKAQDAVVAEAVAKAAAEGEGGLMRRFFG